MADFLKLNGIPISLLVDGGFALDAPLEVGESTRAHDGTARRSRLAFKDSWRGRAAHATPADALALRDYVLGKGHRASWNTSLYTSKGKGPNSSTGLSVNTSAPKLGAGNLRIAAAGSPNTAAYALQLGSKWTVKVWRKQAPGAWVSYVVTSAGHKWQDGSRNDAASTTWLTVSAGTATLSGHATDTVDYDDGVFLPFEIPDAWGPYYHAEGTASREWSELPKLNASGDGIDGGASTKSVIGTAGTTEVMPGALSGTFRSNVHTVEFTLEEA